MAAEVNQFRIDCLYLTVSAFTPANKEIDRLIEARAKIRERVRVTPGTRFNGEMVGMLARRNREQTVGSEEHVEK